MANEAQKPKPQAIVKSPSRASAPQKAGIAGFGNGGTPVSGTMGVPRAGLGQRTAPKNTTVTVPPRTTYSTTVVRPPSPPPPSPPVSPPSPSSTPSAPFSPMPNFPSAQFRPPGGPLPSAPFIPRGGPFPSADIRIPGPELQRFPGAFPDPDRFPNVPTSFSCSYVTAQLLRETVLRDQDILLVDLTGSVLFDGTPGVHTIPLYPINDRLTAPGRAGAFYIGQGQALILTDFVPFAAIPNVGLPGGLISIDPLSLLGQVCFSIVSQEGGHPFNQQSSTPSGTCSGNSILDRRIREGHPVITSTVKTGNIAATYNVMNPPFPGFPHVVGVNAKGYLVDSVLLSQIQNIEVDIPQPVLG